MNHTFKVIFSQALGTFVVVSEHVKGRGKSSKASVILATLLTVTSVNAFGGPNGGVVVAGAAHITQAGNLTTIAQETSRAVINWSTFNIGKGETVQFNQPNINAATLNRVLTATPSVIDGILKANGNVFLVNAAGVMIGKDASVNVGGLVASTLNIKDADFMAGRNHFEGDSDARVQNDGTITVSTGGVAALIGAKVGNTGFISAQEGSALMAGGSSVMLTIGEGAAAHSLVIEKPVVDALVEAGGAIRVGGGQIILAAHAANTLLHKAINQSGVLEAVSMTQKGGQIVLDGGAVGRVDIAGTINADGQTGGKVTATGHSVLVTGAISATGLGDGGEVFIGGGYRGKDTSIANAKNVAVTRAATIDVSSKDNGNGGRTIMFSTGSTAVTGSFRAKGGANGGNGGLVETSGKSVRFDGKVDTTAPHGTDGEYLLDPDMIIISNDAPTAADDARLPNIIESNDGDGYDSTAYVSKNALEAVSTGIIFLEAQGYIQIKDLTANGGSGILDLQPNVSLHLDTTNYTPGSYTNIPTKGMGGIIFDNASNTIRASGTGAIRLQAGVASDPDHSYGFFYAGLYNIGNIVTEDGEVTLFGGSGIDLKGNVTTVNGAIHIDADSDQTSDGNLVINNNISSTIGGDIHMKGGTGVVVNGTVSINEGTLSFDKSKDTLTPVFELNGTIESSNNLGIPVSLTLGDGATIKSAFGVYTNGLDIKNNASVTLIGTNFVANEPITAQGSSTTLNIKAPTLTTDISLAHPDGFGTPLLSQISGVGNINVGSSNYRGAITLAGTTSTAQTLNVRAEGVGGRIDYAVGEVSNVAQLTMRAAGEISFGSFGGDNVTLSANSADIIAGGNLYILSTGTSFSGATYNVSVGNDFTNLAGTSLLSDVAQWRMFLNDSSKLSSSGYTLADGFRRYGCTFEGGCLTGAEVPLAGNGFLFKEAPVLNLIADNKFATYGDAGLLSGIGYSYSGLVNGDSLGSLNLSGSGSVAYTTPATTTSSGNVTSGSHGLQVNQGSLVNTMGYVFGSPSNSGTLTIAKKNITASLNGGTKVYDGTTALPGGVTVTTGGVISGDVVSASVNGSGAFEDKNVGNNKNITSGITLSGVDSSNYTYAPAFASGTASITPKALSLTNVTTANKVYDRTRTATTTAQLVGRVAGDDVTAEVFSSLFATNNAGNGKTVNTTFQLLGSDVVNYSFSGAPVASTANITPKLLSAPTFILYDKVYDGSTYLPRDVFPLTGVIAGDSVSVLTLGNFADKNVGNNKTASLTFILQGSNNSNYKFESTGTSSLNTTGTASITHRHLTASSIVTSNKTYDGTTAAATTASLLNVVSGDAVSLNITGSNFSDKNAGTGKTVNTSFAISGAGASNYVLDTTTGTSTADIAKKQLSAQINGIVSKEYDGNNAVYYGGLDVTGLILNDDVSIDATPEYDNKNAGANKPITITLTMQGGDTQNYDLVNTMPTATADINQKVVNAINIATANKVYDGTTEANTTAQLDAAVAGDDIAVVTSASNFDNKNAGTGKSVTSALALTGEDANNYVLNNESASSTADITKKQVTASVAATIGKEYDGTTSALAFITPDGFIETDNVGIMHDANFSDKNAGLNKTVTTTLQVLGPDAGNYELQNDTLTSTADIVQKQIAATNVITANKVYDGTTTAVTTAELQDVVSGDDVSVATTVSDFADKNAGSDKEVTSVLALSGADANNYVLADSNATSTADINKKGIDVVNVTTSNKVYDRTDTAVTTGELSGLVAGDTASAVVATSTFDNKNAGTGKTVSSNFQISGVDAGNYQLNNLTSYSTADIIRKSVSATDVVTSNKVYNGNRNALTTANLNGAFVEDFVSLAITGSIFSDKNAGIGKSVTTSFGLSGADAGNYLLSSTIAYTNADITKKAVDAINISTANKVYDSTTTANTSATLQGVVGGDTLTISSVANFADKNVGVGKNVVSNFTLGGSGVGNYTLNNTSATTTANITPASLIITGISAHDKEYDGTNEVTGLTMSSIGLFAGDTVNIDTLTAAFSDKNVGNSKPVTFEVTLSGADSTNYVLNQSTFNSNAAITPKTISFTNVTSANKVYDGTTQASTTAALQDVVAGDSVSIDTLSSEFADKNAGVGKSVTSNFALTGSDAANYTLDTANATSTADISKRQLSATNIVSEDRVYNGLTYADTTADLQNVVGSEDVSAEVVDSNFSDKNVGLNKTVTSTISLVGADAGNYVLDNTAVNSLASINQKTLYTTFSTSNKVYDGSTNAITSVFFDTPIISGDTVSSEIVYSVFDTKNVGNGKFVETRINLTGADSGNYRLASPVDNSFANITPKFITASNISSANKVYDGTRTASTTATVSGVIAGDVVNVGATTSLFDTKDAGAGKSVASTLALSGANANNYRLNNQNVTSTAYITPKPIDAINVVTSNKSYTANTWANTTAGLQGVIAGDTVNATASSSNFSDKNVGTGKTVTSTLALAGANAGNYTLNNPGVTSYANITPTIMIVYGVMASNKVYDSTTTASAIVFADSGYTGDDVSAVVTGASFNNKNVGNNKAVSTTLGLTGADAGNYYLNTTTYGTTANITPYSATATNIITSNKVYDGTTAASTTASLQNVFAGDVVSVGATVSAFANKNAGVAKLVSNTFALSGADSGNYTLSNPNASSSADIMPKHILASSLVTANKVYDGTTTASTTAALQDLVENDAVAVSTVSSVFDDKNAGSAKTVNSTLALSGVDAGNYVLDNENASSTADITQKHINAINVSTDNKVYDGTTVALTRADLDEVIVNDAVMVATTSSSFDDKNAGVSKAVTSELTLSGADAGNYVLDNQWVVSAADITQKSLSATNITTNNKVYDGTTSANTTAQLADVVSNDDVDVTAMASNFADKNAGNGKVVSSTLALTGTDAANYTLSNQNVVSSADITPKGIDAINVGTSNKTYNATTMANTWASLQGVVTGDAVSVSTTASNFADKNVGTGKTVTSALELGGADATNYALNNASVMSFANITPTLLVVNGIFAFDKVYDSTSNAAAVALASGAYAGDDISAVVLSAAFNNKHVGNNKTVTASIGKSGIDAANYALSATTVSSTASITPYSITAGNINTVGKVYDSTTNANTSASLQNVFAGDLVNVGVVASNFSDKNVGVAKSVNSTLALAGTDAANYTLSNTNVVSTADITQKQLNAINVVTSGKVYDATTAASTTLALQGIEGSDFVDATVTASDFADKNAGSNKTVTSTILLTGVDSGNYALDNSNVTSTADITQKHINAINVSTANKVYDGTTVATTSAALDQVVGGDQVTVTTAASAFDNKNAGSNKNVTSVLALTGADAGNYVLDNQNATSTADITQKHITAAASTLNKTYDGTTAATTTAVLYDVVTNDVVDVLTASSAFTDKNAGSNKTVSSTLSLSGSDAANFVLDNPTIGSTASIGQKQISAANVTTGNKVYDGTTAATTTATLQDVVLNDDVAVAAAASNFNTKNAGANKTVNSTLTLTGSDASNYALDSANVTSTADITQKHVNAINVATADKVYDGSAVATTTANVDDVVEGDMVTVTTSASTFVDKNAGAGKTVNSVLTLAGVDAANYILDNQAATSAANITQKHVNAGAVTTNKVYDGTTKASTTASLQDVVTGDAVNVTTITSEFSDKNAGANKAVTSTVAISGADSGNYVLDAETITSQASINQKQITAKNVATANKVYDGNSAATTTATLDELVGTDVVTVASISSAFSDKNVGSNKTVNTSLVLAGADAANYVLDNQSATSSASITPKNILVSGGVAQSKVYDSTTSAQVVGTTVTGAISGDDVIAAATGKFADKNAGADKAVEISYALSGADAQNYVLTDTVEAGVASITRKALDFAVSTSGPTTVEVTGSPLPTSTLNPSLVGVISGDDLQVGGVGYTSNNVPADGSTTGTYRAVITGLAGQDAGNYELDAQSVYSLANTAVVTVTPVVVTEPDPIPDPQPEPEPKPEPQPEPEPKPEPQPEPKPEPQPDPKPEPQPEPKPEPKPEPQPDPGPKPGPQPGPKPLPTTPPVVMQADNSYSPVYASGRIIDTRGPVTSTVTDGVDAVDARKGTHAVAVGTRRYNILDDMKVANVKVESINIPVTDVKVEGVSSLVDVKNGTIDTANRKVEVTTEPKPSKPEPGTDDEDQK